MTLTERAELEVVWDLLLVSHFPLPRDFTNSHMLTFQSFMRGQGDIKEGKCTREQVNGYWRNICVITYSHPEVAVKEPVSHKMAGVSYPPRLVFQSGYSNKSSPMLRKNLNSLGAGYKYFLDFHNMIFKDYSCKRCKTLVKKWKKILQKQIFSNISSINLALSEIHLCSLPGIKYTWQIWDMREL